MSRRNRAASSRLAAASAFREVPVNTMRSTVPIDGKRASVVWAVPSLSGYHPATSADRVDDRIIGQLPCPASAPQKFLLDREALGSAATARSRTRRGPRPRDLHLRIDGETQRPAGPASRGYQTPEQHGARAGPPARRRVGFGDHAFIRYRRTRVACAALPHRGQSSQPRTRSVI